MPRFMTFEELANETHPTDPAAAAEMLAQLRHAQTEVCNVCGTETYRIHAYDGPEFDDEHGGRGTYDICNDCMGRAKKTAELLGWTIAEEEGFVQ